MRIGPQMKILSLLLCFSSVQGGTIFFGVYSDADCKIPMVDGHTEANMTLATNQCSCMSYDDGSGYIQSNCNYDPVCQDDGLYLSWTQRVSVTDMDNGCTDEGGGKIIEAQLHSECTAVMTHMGTTYQKLLSAYDPTEVCSSVSTLSSPPSQYIVDKMTQEEKYSLVNGIGWKTKIQQDGYYIGNIPGIPRLSVPSIKMQDAAQGFRTTDVRQVGQVTSWPCSLGVSAAWDVDLMESWGTALGAEHRSKGANVILGPSINVHRIAKGGRNAEYISGESPALGSMLTPAYVRGVQGAGVMAVAKHFALNNQETFRNEVNSVADERTMMEVYYPPFLAAVQSGVASFMCAYNLVNGTHACGNDELLRRDLKGRMGFEGFVMSDWWAVHDVDYPNAGLDMDMPGDDGNFGDANLERLDPAVVDDMVARIVGGMMEVGLMAEEEGGNVKFPSLCEIPDGCDDLYFNETATSDEHVALARKIGAEGAVLLKNDGGILPLDDGIKKIAVVGSACDPPNDIERMLKIWNVGNYFVMGGSGRVIPASPISVLEGVKEASVERGIEIVDSISDSVEDGVEAMDDADVVILCGATTSTEGTDRENLYLDQDDFLKEILAQTGEIPTVVVTITPGATVLSNFADSADGILNVFLAGEETGHAVADILFGSVNPSGKLPVTFLISEDDAVEPCNFLELRECVYEEGVLVGYRRLQDKDVGFAFGHGLSYTNFEYEWGEGGGIKRDGGEIKITNSGKMAGKEVVQVRVGNAYVHALQPWAHA